MLTPNRICLKCGKPYAARGGRITGGLCPDCVKKDADQAKAWAQDATRGTLAYRPYLG